jgi:hypothetical protein
LQALLKATLADAQPMLLKELAKNNLVTLNSISRQFFNMMINKALAITRTML